MASAGRILIMPKGEWNTETEYEMLDLVSHNGRSWLAKKNAVGIEPRDENAEYWQDMFGIDLSPYATKSDLGKYLPLTGGALSGNITINNGLGLIYATDVYALFEARKDEKNYTHIRLANPKTSTNINDLIRISDCRDGALANYRLFGEHNLDLLNQYIDARIAEKMK